MRTNDASASSLKHKKLLTARPKLEATWKTDVNGLKQDTELGLRPDS